MKDKELRRIIGERAKSRRTELNLTQPYVADKMGVTASTIQRYEAGTIDNTKKMVLEGLSEALHVSVEWLKGETDSYETDITDKKELLIRDAMTGIIENLPTNLDNADGDFAKNLLLAILNEYKLFADSFTNACNNSGKASYEQRKEQEKLLRKLRRNVETIEAGLAEIEKQIAAYDAKFAAATEYNEADYRDYNDLKARYDHQMHDALPT